MKHKKKSAKSTVYNRNQLELALIKSQLNVITKTVQENKDEIKDLKTKIDMGSGAVKIFIFFCSLVSGLVGYKLFGDG